MFDIDVEDKVKAETRSRSRHAGIPGAELLLE